MKNNPYQKTFRSIEKNNDYIIKCKLLIDYMLLRLVCTSKLSLLFSIFRILTN